MPAIVSRTEIVVKSGAELLGDGFVLDEVGMPSIGIIGVYRGGSDVFSYPGGIPRSTIETRGRGKCRVEIVGRTRKAILEDTCRADWGDKIFAERRKLRDWY